jgi:hypothetical protein
MRAEVDIARRQAVTRIDRIGLDLGNASQAEAHASAAAELGPDMVRLRFGLAGHLAPDEEYLAEAGRVVDTLRGKGLRILALVDSDLTVAPEGMGAFLDRPPGPLARAWTEEICGNASLLAAAIGDRVAAWELLPRPNVGSPARIAPGRWASLLASLAQAIRDASPGAHIVSGALISEDLDDGLEYLRAAWRAATSGGRWPNGLPPFDSLGLQLGLMPDGGETDIALAAALIERMAKIAAGLAELAGPEAEPPDLMVTGLGWDAGRTGEDVQARNLWAALDALTAVPEVRMVIWSGLNDANPHIEGATGLCREEASDEGSRRAAWRAFRDFATYARQISPSPLAEAMRDAAAAAGLAAMPTMSGGVPVAEAEGDTEPIADPIAEIHADPNLDSISDASTDASTDAPPEALESPEPVEAPKDMMWEGAPPAGEADSNMEAAAFVVSGDAAETDDDRLAEVLDPSNAAFFEVDETVDSETDEALSDEDLPAELEIAKRESPYPERETPRIEEEDVHFEIPNSEAVLRARGFEGARLAAVLAAVERRYGGHAWLPPGEYTVTVPRLPHGAGETAGDGAIAPGEAAPPGQDPIAEPRSSEPPTSEAPSSEPPTPEAPFSESPSSDAETAPGFSNQQMISALYRAGGGTWSLFERAGLNLRDLAARRTQPYEGPDPSSFDGLDEAERSRLLRELDLPASPA